MPLLELSSWGQFKDTCFTKKNLNNQFTEDADGYDLYGPDANGLTWHVRLRKADESAEFESSYKAMCNWAIGNRPYAFSTPDFIFNGDAVLGTVPAGTSHNIDFAIPGALGTFQYINGAVVITNNAAFGDYASAKVVDVDNLLGYGAGTVLSSYVSKWYINPFLAMDIETPYAGKVPAGMYMRITYTSVGGTDVGVAINFRLHTPI